MRADTSGILINAEFVKPLFELAPQYDVDPANLLTQADLLAEEIQRPSSYLPFHKVQSLISAALEQYSLPGLGLIYGKTLTLSSHGMAGISAMTQLTVSDLFLLMERISPWAFPPITIKYCQRGDMVGVGFTPALPLGTQYEFLIETICTSFLHNFRYLFPGAELAKVEFGYTKPSHAQMYDELFQCEVSFGQEETLMFVCREMLDKQLALANEQTSRIAEESFYALTPVPTVETLPEKVLKLLKSDLGTYMRADAVAKELSISPRTLRRRLSSINVSFRALLDEVRKDIAIKMLREQRHTFTEIAFALHFCDSSAFANAFRNWTGMSAREFLDRDVASA